MSFEKAGTRKKNKTAPKSVRDAIGKLQPYKRGYGAPIWAMNGLGSKNIQPAHGSNWDTRQPMLSAHPSSGLARLDRLNSALPVWKTPDDEPIIMTAKGAGNQYERYPCPSNYAWPISTVSKRRPSCHS